uniref:Uncharacterized protein n=1 Tax=Setaria viridis TaxID=4556 RepID=A0A4U6VTX8_SETVI|nr:hypothetical protein SEVIR_2G168450v2 [Setaria viridis]
MLATFAVVLGASLTWPTQLPSSWTAKWYPSSDGEDRGH